MKIFGINTYIIRSKRKERWLFGEGGYVEREREREREREKERGYLKEYGI